MFHFLVVLLCQVNIKKAVDKNGNSDQAAYKLLSLNRLMWDLLIESCVWYQRLHSLLSPDVLRVDAAVAEKVKQEHSCDSKLESTATGDDVSINGSADMEVLSNTPMEVNELTKDIPIRGPLSDSNEQGDPPNTSDVSRNFEIPIAGDASLKRSIGQDLNFRLNVSNSCPSTIGSLQAKDLVSNHLQGYESLPVSPDSGPLISDLKVLNKSATLYSPSSNLLLSNDWFWKPFADIRQISTRDLQKKCLPKFESVSSSITEYLPMANKLIVEEGTRLHVSLKNNAHVVSDYEGELSSIIACALAMLKDSYAVTEVDTEYYRRENGIASKAAEIPQGLIDITSPHAVSSTDSDSLHSTGSTSSEESRAPSRAPENHGVEIAMGYAKSLGREKYFVICQYVNQFRELRNWCCPSELDYIASLSRCRNWDAKGGKSKSFFAKTIDDRLIIKEIKKTELESFLGFAPLYFKYMKESIESGSQTCLAKVLGIYQVGVLFFIR